MYTYRVIIICFNYSPPQLFVRVWLLENDAPSNVALEPINVTNDQRLFGMARVIYTNWTRWILASSIKEFAYIFHRDNINLGLYSNVNGMGNSYYTKYQTFTDLSGLYVVSPYYSNKYIPFFHLTVHLNSIEPSHHIMCVFLMEIKKNTDTVLWTERKFQAANEIGRTYLVLVSIKSWKCFCSRLEEDKSFDEVDFGGYCGRKIIKTF